MSSDMLVGRAVRVRSAVVADGDQLAAIWNHEVLGTDATTDTEPRDGRAQREWLERHRGDASAVVAAVGDEVLAYGSLSPYRPKPAFARTLEDSVYVKRGHRGAGLGTSASFSIYLLPPALRRFRSRYPKTELTVVTGNAPEIARGVVQNDLDVGIVSLPVRERELAVTAFHRHELVAIAPPDRRWRRGQRVRASELAREPLILFEPGATLRRVIDAWFQRAGVAPALPMELNNTEAIKKLVESGLGLSVTSWFSVEAEVRARKLAAARLEPPLYRDIGVIRRKDKPKTPVLEAFLATLDGLRRSFE